MASFNSLVTTLPDLGTPWAPVAGQLHAEGVDTDTINSLRDSYADVVGQITSGQLGSGALLDPQTAMAQAAGFIAASQTALGAVQGVVGLVNTAVHVSSPAQALQAANMLTGTLIAVATAAGAVSAGVGALVVAGVGIAVDLLSSLFGGSPPAATVCGSNLSEKPNIVVGCTFTLGLPAAPGAPMWRPFPDPTVAGDAGWFTQSTGGSPHYLAGAVWRGDEWQGTFTSSPTRLIDQAFPDYRTIAAEQPLPSEQGVFWDFKRAFFAAWQANKAYALNGLVPRTDEELLFHFVNVWNRAHDNSQVLALTPGATGTGLDYEASIIKNIAYENPPNAPISGGKLQINIGPRKNPPVYVQPLVLHGLSSGNAGATLSPGGASTTPTATGPSTTKRVVVAVVIAAGAGAAGIGVWALLSHQSYLGALKGFWKVSGGKVVAAVNPLPASAAEESTKTQTLLFPRPRYSESRAKAWAKAHNYLAYKTDITENYIRLRQRPPSDFKKGSFRTISLGSSGVKAVIGHPR